MPELCFLEYIEKIGAKSLVPHIYLERIDLKELNRKFKKTGESSFWNPTLISLQIC